MPQPMHSSSDMNAILSAGATSIHNFPTKKEVFLNTETDIKPSPSPFAAYKMEVCT